MHYVFSRKIQESGGAYNNTQQGTWYESLIQYLPHALNVLIIRPRANFWISGLILIRTGLELTTTKIEIR